ncbi:hypothetical protein BC829DRAFT_488956 [Chytridium lagenaria]|nr:hypothetical protein BC829DRAFT_488956 [Chytridium lagenaria]
MEDRPIRSIHTRYYAAKQLQTNAIVPVDLASASTGFKAVENPASAEQEDALGASVPEEVPRRKVQVSAAAAAAGSVAHPFITFSVTPSSPANLTAEREPELPTFLGTRFQRSILTSDAKASTVAEECISSIRTVSALNAQTRMLNRYSALLDLAVKLGMKESIAPDMQDFSLGLHVCCHGRSDRHDQSFMKHSLRYRQTNVSHTVSVVSSLALSSINTSPFFSTSPHPIKFTENTPAPHSTCSLSSNLSTDSQKLQGASVITLGTFLQLLFTLLGGAIISMFYGWKLALVRISYGVDAFFVKSGEGVCEERAGLL